MIIPYKNITPTVDESVFVAQGAHIIGDVEIGAESSVWFGVTIRGDVNDIKIGKRTNIQDNSVIHVTTDFQGTYIGDDVTVGHAVILHACTIGNNCLIGMGACVMDGAIVEDNAMVAAGALVTPGKIVKSGELWSGSPARFMREMKDDEKKYVPWSAKHYAALARDYMGH